MNRVFVTGIGVVTPIGQTLEDFAKALRSGKSGITYIEQFDTSKHSVKIAGEIKNFDPTPYINKKEIRRHDRYSQFAMAAAYMAIKQAKLEAGTFIPEKVGVIVSTGIGGIQTFENEYNVMINQGPSRVSPFLVPMMICNIASGHISMAYGFKGPSFCVVSACASGLHAIGEAYLKLFYGQLDICIAGGSEGAITPLTVAGFAQMKALSTRNDEPQKASRPFDKDRDGFVMGEGAAILVLETEESLKRRNVTPLAEIVGYGASADAYHLTAPDPNGDGAAKAMNDAITFNNIDKKEINYINAHATSTPIGDIAEVKAIKKVFDLQSKKLVVNATKSMIGHLLGAAGAVATAATIVQIINNFVHPTINLENQDEEIDLDCVPLQARDYKIKYGLINSFGFGGQNASLLVKRVE